MQSYKYCSIIKILVYIACFFTVLPSVAKAQHFAVDRLIDSKEVPCEAFLYKHSSAVVTQAARNIFAQYNVSSSFSGSRELFFFSGDSLGLVLMNKTNLVFWIEDLGDEKSVLYLTAFRNNTREYVAALGFSAVLGRIKEYLNAIEVECINITSQLFLSEQYLKVFRLTDELQTLYDDLQRLELYTPNATTQINQLRSSIRIKRAALSQETDILNQFKNTLEM